MVIKKDFLMVEELVKWRPRIANNLVELDIIYP